MTQIPQQYQGMTADAARQLGVPLGIVAAQIDLESGWNPDAVSPTGAQGIAQFEPGTWAQYGHGSPFDPAAAFAAYVRYMAYLLGIEGGDIRRALEAYNAGPGNLGAGAGYADTILSRAGTADATAGPEPPTAAAGVSFGGPLGWLNPLNVTSDTATIIGDVFGPVSNAIQEFYKGFVVMMRAVVWLVNPANWVRIIAGIVGTASLIAGIVLVARAT